MVQYLLVCSFLYDEYYARICIFYIFFRQNNNYLIKAKTR